MGRAKIKAPNTLLLPYQARWVKDRSRLKIAEKSRQIGWTWATAYSIDRRKSLVDAKLDAWITSRDDEQARLFLEDCKSFANLLQVGATDLGERVYDEKGSTAYALQFANGLRLHSMSSNPNAQAGKRGDRILDEFALHPDQRALFGIAYPGITWGGQLEIFSTHRGSGSLFNQLITETKEGKRKFSLHRVTLEDALNQGFLDKLQSKLPDDDERQEMDEQQYYDYVKADCVDDEMFNQEYMCIPSNDETAFISYPMLTSCHMGGHAEDASHVVIEMRELARPGVSYWVANDPIGNGPLYLGVDIGRHKDFTVMWLAEEVAGRLVTRKVGYLVNVKFRQQEKIMRTEFLDLPNFTRACIDMTGIGEQMAENAHEDYGHMVEPVRFTGPVKEQLAFGLRGDMEDALFLIPNDPKTDGDFRKIKKTTTATGNLRFDGDRDKDGHSDRFWGAALCREAKGKKRVPAGASTADLKEDVFDTSGRRSRRSFM